MIQIPVIRWGQPYESLEFDQVDSLCYRRAYCKSGTSQPGGMIQRDMRKAQAVRDALTAIDIEDLIGRVVRAGGALHEGDAPHRETERRLPTSSSARSLRARVFQNACAA